MPRWPPSRRGWRPSWLCDARHAPGTGAPTLAPRPRRLWPPPTHGVWCPHCVCRGAGSRSTRSRRVRKARAAVRSRASSERAPCERASPCGARRPTPLERRPTISCEQVPSSLRELLMAGSAPRCVGGGGAHSGEARGELFTLRLSARQTCSCLGGRDHHLTHNAHICAPPEAAAASLAAGPLIPARRGCIPRHLRRARLARP